MKSIRRHRQGVATAMALAMLALATAAMAALGSLAAADARRTRAMQDGAQLRQVLLAAAQQIEFRLARSNTLPAGEIKLELPGELADVQLSAAVEVGTQRIRVSATRGRQTMPQTMMLKLEGGVWRIAEIKLEPGSKM